MSSEAASRPPGSFGTCDSAHQLMTRALEKALPRLEPRTTKGGNTSLWPLEATVADEMANAMAELGVPPSRVGTVKRYIEHDWDPLPNGLDLYVTSGEGSALAIAAELKLEEVPQTMWDLYKLMAARKLAGAPDTYLVMGAHASCWRKPCGELFPAQAGETRVIDTVELFSSNRSQYTADLKYRARVRFVPTSVRVEAVTAGVSPQHYPHLEFRVSAVRPEDATPIPCIDGWPLGTEPAGN